eukprot:7389054-Prymnesium_polylepis.2
MLPSTQIGCPIYLSANSDARGSVVAVQSGAARAACQFQVQQVAGAVPVANRRGLSQPRRLRCGCRLVRKLHRVDECRRRR